MNVTPNKKDVLSISPWYSVSDFFLSLRNQENNRSVTYLSEKKMFSYQLSLPSDLVITPHEKVSLLLYNFVWSPHKTRNTYILDSIFLDLWNMTLEFW